MLDCDLLIGRDIATAGRVGPAELSSDLAAGGVRGGVVTSLRALLFDMTGGNDEAIGAAGSQGWWPAAGLDLRDPVGAEQEIGRLRDNDVRAVRLAPLRQGIPPQAPGIRAVAQAAVERGLMLLVEGDVRVVGPALTGLGARVIFLDLHFYHLGDFVILSRSEPGFHASTRLLGNPDGWETFVAKVGADRLVFGSRPGWFEAAAVHARLTAARLDEGQRSLIVEGNLRRLLGGDT